MKTSQNPTRIPNPFANAEFVAEETRKKLHQEAADHKEINDLEEVYSKHFNVVINFNNVLCTTITNKVLNAFYDFFKDEEIALLMFEFWIREIMQEKKIELFLTMYDLINRGYNILHTFTDTFKSVKSEEEDRLTCALNYDLDRLVANDFVISFITHFNPNDVASSTMYEQAEEIEIEIVTLEDVIDAFKNDPNVDPIEKLIQVLEHHADHVSINDDDIS